MGSKVYLPGREICEIPPEKIRLYLLNHEHIVGRSKAKFFNSVGFTGQNWQILAVALKEHAQKNTVTRTEKTEFGTKYSIEGKLNSPDGRNPLGRAIWFIDYGEQVPRLVTVHPLPILKELKR
ncbi:MAG: hypothetical protein A2W80_05375 [Candidatus Riflebacteria bacterium GWC2_50_8]|nr:MAG: hypothetical protein A2W80_05375 [Candidatus Riflebacteria bacterium GWC2_50_8]